MPLQPWPESHRERLTRFKVFDVLVAHRTNPRTGRQSGMFHIDTPDWVNVVAFTPDDEMLLVRQWRHGTADFSLEIPGGLIDPEDPDPAAAAARELEEETGHRPERVVALGSMTPNPALFTNTCYTYLAEGCREVGGLQQDAGEDIEVVKVPATEVPELVRSGQLHHALALAGLYLHRIRPQD